MAKDWNYENNQMETLEVKRAITKVKSIMDISNSWFKKSQRKKINELEDISEEVSRIKNRRKKDEKYRRKGQRKRCM